LKSNLEKWILNDHNPFIVFSNDGKVIYLNDAGEYVLSFVNPKMVYDMIISFAPQEPKFEYIHENFIFGDFIYDYALIGYDNFDEIGVRFYKNIKPLEKVKKISNTEKLNIYFLLDFAKTYTFIDEDIEFIDLFDPDIPQIMSNKDELIKVFSNVFALLKNNTTIKTEVKIKVGEYMRFDNKKYSILQIDIYAKNIKYSRLNYNMVDIRFFDNKISISIPLITK
jgi:hypothetical protein